MEFTKRPHAGLRTRGPQVTDSNVVTRLAKISDGKVTAEPGPAAGRHALTDFYDESRAIPQTKAATPALPRDRSAARGKGDKLSLSADEGGAR